MSLQVVQVQRWQDHAVCAGADPRLFYPDDGVDTRRAKAYCNVCPVWSDCLAYGLDDDHGVWGGLTRAERARLRHLQERFAARPDDPDNARDVRWLTNAGMTPERLACLLGCSVETIAALGRRQRRRRRVAVR